MKNPVLMKRFLEDAKKIIRINSVSTNGNEEVANFVTALMQDRGMKTQLQHVTHSNEAISKRQFNAIGILGDPLVDRKIKKGLLLNTHLDTVSPGLNENWTRTNQEPFSATIVDGLIYGLGVADVKLDFLCKLYAAERFREKKLRNPIYLVGTCGEEIGMFGAKYLIKSGALNPKYVLVGEPSELKVVYAHKCLSIYKASIGFQMIAKDARGFNRKVELKAYGKSAHSSYPHLGQNAIWMTLEFLQKAIDQGFEIRFTKMGGGDTINKVPDQASVQFYLPSHQFEDFKRYFRENSKGPSHRFEVELEGAGDAGVRFLPEVFFACLSEVTQLFKQVGLELSQVKDDTYLPDHTTVNFGKLSQNIGGFEAYFDFRMLPSIALSELDSKIKAGIQKIAEKYPSLNVKALPERTNPGLNMSLDDELPLFCKEAMLEVGIEPVFYKKATSTEAAQYYQAGYQAVVFGPGESVGNSHSPNEKNVLDQLELAIEFYEKVIEKACL